MLKTPRSRNSSSSFQTLKNFRPLRCPKLDWERPLLLSPLCEEGLGSLRRGGVSRLIFWARWSGEPIWEDDTLGVDDDQSAFRTGDEGSNASSPREEQVAQLTILFLQLFVLQMSRLFPIACSTGKKQISTRIGGSHTLLYVCTHRVNAQLTQVCYPIPHVKWGGGETHCSIPLFTPPGEEETNWKQPLSPLPPSPNAQQQPMESPEEGAHTCLSPIHTLHTQRRKKSNTGQKEEEVIIPPLLPLSPLSELNEPSCVFQNRIGSGRSVASGQRMSSKFTKKR